MALLNRKLVDDDLAHRAQVESTQLPAFFEMMVALTLPGRRGRFGLPEPVTYISCEDAAEPPSFPRAVPTSVALAPLEGSGIIALSLSAVAVSYRVEAGEARKLQLEVNPINGVARKATNASPTPAHVIKSRIVARLRYQRVVTLRWRPNVERQLQPTQSSERSEQAHRLTAARDVIRSRADEYVASAPARCARRDTP